MISYDPFWKLVKKRKISQYDLEKEYEFSHRLLDRLRNNKGLTTTTIDTICSKLDCKIEEIIEHKKET